MPKFSPNLPVCIREGGAKGNDSPACLHTNTHEGIAAGTHVMYASYIVWYSMASALQTPDTSKGPVPTM